MRNSLVIKDEKEQLKKRCFELLDVCKVEIRDFKPEELDEYNSLKDKITNLNNELRELETKLNPEENKSINKLNKVNTMEFRLLKAINDIANNRNLDATASAVISNGTEEMRKSGLSYGGQIQLPVNELRADITVANEGVDVVPTDLYDILEPLRAKNVLVNAGAKFLTGLVGDVQVPVMGAGNVTWEGETAAAKDAGVSFTNVKLSPKRLTAYVNISKQFLAQDSKSAEAMIRTDIINAINSKLESTILGAGAGSATEPTGLFYTTGTLSTIASYADVADLEADVEDANVVGECTYIMSNKAKSGLRTMQKGNGVGFVYENGSVDGTKALNTSNVPATDIAYGDFSNLAIGQWGAIDLTVDPYTEAKNGMIVLVVNAYFDAKVLRPNAIKVAKL